MSEEQDFKAEQEAALAAIRAFANREVGKPTSEATLEALRAKVDALNEVYETAADYFSAAESELEELEVALGLRHRRRF